MKLPAETNGECVDFVSVIIIVQRSMAYMCVCVCIDCVPLDMICAHNLIANDPNSTYIICAPKIKSIEIERRDKRNELNSFVLCGMDYGRQFN